MALKDIILTYIDDIFDIDELENLGDFVRSIIVVENLNGLQLTEALRQLHTDLLQNLEVETNRTNRLRVKTAIIHLENNFSDQLIAKETDSLPYMHD
jgi:hypothetical protein